MNGLVPGWGHLTEEQDARARSMGGKITGVTRAREAEARRREFLRIVETEGVSIKDACARIGVTDRTYRNWRKDHPLFRAAIDAARGSYDRKREVIAAAGELDFVPWRERWLGNKSTWFQAKMAEALLDDSKGGGSITLVLFPPEHGKTTLIEDFCTWRLATNKDYRITYGSESQNHSRKALRRVRNRLEIDGPYPDMVATFGPFAPPPKSWDHKGNQPWGQDFFDIHGREKSDERDYSMVALGFNSQIAGTRSDLLVGDDLCSMRNVAQSEKLIDTFRQDWLSRPGTKGRTVVIGTRVADGDIYDLMEDADIVDFVVRFKAHDPSRIVYFGTPWLWPERYDESEYARMRRNVGESAWARNYQQAPRLAGDSTFTEAMIEKCSMPLRGVNSEPPLDVLGIVLGIDPGFGKNATVALGVGRKMAHVLDARIHEGLTNNEQIFAVAEQLYLDVSMTADKRLPLLHVAIEDKAFQKGLLDDDALHRFQKAYGFSFHGHQTGANKYDPMIGVPGIAPYMNREEITLPGADDEATERFKAKFHDQLLRWRPHKKGTALEQDLVMAYWFAFLWWTKFRDAMTTHGSGATTLQTQALPWRPAALPGGLTRMR